MGAFYGNKIKNKEINLKSGKAWVIEEVPSFWREKTEQWLKSR